VVGDGDNGSFMESPRMSKPNPVHLGVQLFSEYMTILGKDALPRHLAEQIGYFDVSEELLSLKNVLPRFQAMDRGVRAGIIENLQAAIELRLGAPQKREELAAA
jgi:hypothetical protein